jgi:hypothetical protein
VLIQCAYSMCLCQPTLCAPITPATGLSESRIRYAGRKNQVIPHE